MATHPVDANEFCNCHLLGEHRLFTVDRIGVVFPLNRLIRNLKGVENIDIKVVPSEQQLVNTLQKEPRLGSLDNAMVVGAGDGYDLGNSQRREVCSVGAFKLCRVINVADSDDDALTGHQPRN